MTANLIAALIIGISSSAHCIFMCGGISASFAPDKKESNYAPWLLSLCFHFGRLASYALIGLFFGLLIHSVDSLINIGTWLRILAGLMLILMGLYLANIWRGLTYIERLMEPIWRPISARLKSFIPAKTIKDALVIGVFWGWLPCGLVYSTLVWASTSNSPQETAILMFTMGLGTTPVLLGISFFGKFLRQKWTPLFSGLLLCGFGIWTLSMPLMHVISDTEHSGHHHQSNESPLDSNNINRDTGGHSQH